MTPTTTVKPVLKWIFRRAGYQVTRYDRTVTPFHSTEYLRHNARRLEHLASLGIPVFGKTVLEVGAGIGDHTTYYLDRGCRMTVTEARPDNLSVLRRRYPETQIEELNLDAPSAAFTARFDVVHCYGLLYHLKHPGEAIRFMGERCSSVMFLETCVSFGNEELENLIDEDQEHSTQSFVGVGCRPTRPWVFAALKRSFPYVYCPTTQPNHREFPLDWRRPEAHTEPLSRAVFVASRTPIESPVLSSTLVDVQVRHP